MDSGAGGADGAVTGTSWHDSKAQEVLYFVPLKPNPTPASRHSSLEVRDNFLLDFIRWSRFPGLLSPLQPFGHFHAYPFMTNGEGITEYFLCFQSILN